MKNKCLLLAGAFIFLFKTASADFFLGGYYKNFSTIFAVPAYKIGDDLLHPPDLGLVNNRIRLKFRIGIGDSLNFHAAYDLSPRIQDPSFFEENIFLMDFSPPAYRVDDFRYRIYPGPEKETGSFGLFSNLDRLFFSVRLPFADIYLGRQAIAWGSARVVNPTDIIAPFAFNELDPEERRGVDALRIRIPLGMMDELDLGFVAGPDLKPDQSAVYLRGKTYLFQTDLSLLVMKFFDHFLVGIDVSRSIGGAGFWFEAAYVRPYFFDRETDAGERDNFRLSLGMDYSLSAKTYGFVEYHFSSAGKSRPEDYMNLLRSSSFRQGSVYLMGRHYLALGVTYQITPLLPFTGLVLINANDGSFMLAPKLDFNISENIYLAGGAYVGIGKKPERILGPIDIPPILQHSEFGTYPDMFFVSFRVYF
ncbi:MAG: hypothetical protein JXB26_08885 [Candidatus Aminicenantes bacterium]|nr:hypothetical protein [Candidatus Aminicenantes bacterium]